MPAPVTDELKSFHEFVGHQLGNGGAGLSPEDVVSLWRERMATLEAVQVGLDDVEAGRTKPLEEFVADFEKRHGIESGT